MMYKSSASKDIITAIDLGSSHCLTLIAQRDAHGELQIVGMGNIKSRGIKRAIIINLEEASDTINRSLEDAERMCGNNVESVYLNISGQHIASLNSNGIVTVANEEIDEGDIDRAIDAARAVSLPADREVLNLTPRFYTVDGQEGIQDPMRMVGMRLEVDIHLITASSSALRNLEKALGDIGLNKETFVFSGYAASEVVLSDIEKGAGAICIDIGSDTTDYCVYVDGAIQYSGVIPIGGRHVTQDIHAYTRIGLENAEKIKIALGEENPQTAPQRPDEARDDYRRRIKAADILNLAAYNPDVKPSTMSRATLIRSVITPRVKEIFSMIAEQLARQKLSDKLAAGAVVVGGAAKTVGLTEIASRTLGMQVRVGVPKGIGGIIKHVDDPAYATALGLLRYAEREQQVVPSVTPEKNAAKQNGFIDKIFSGLGDAFKKIVP